MLARMIRQSLLKNARVTAWSLATLTASAALATIFFTMSIDVGDKMTASLRTLGANSVVHPLARGASDEASARRWSRLRELAGARHVDVAVLRLLVGTIEGAPVQVVTADPGALSRMTPYWALQGMRADAPGTCVMGQKLARILGTTVGSTVELSLEGAAKPERFRVVGLFDSGDEDEGRMFVARDPAAGSPGFEYALLSVPGGEPAIDRLRATLAEDGLELTPLRQVLHGEREVISKINLLTGVALVVVLLLSAVGVTAAVLSRILERRKELALFQAIGATRQAIVKFLLLEGAAIGAVAALLGYLAGLLLSRLIVRQVFGVSISPHLSSLLAAATVSIVIAVMAAAIGARRALRMETAVLLKGE